MNLLELFGDGITRLIDDFRWRLMEICCWRLTIEWEVEEWKGEVGEGELFEAPRKGSVIDLLASFPDWK